MASIYFREKNLINLLKPVKNKEKINKILAVNAVIDEMLLNTVCSLAGDNNKKNKSKIFIYMTYCGCNFQI